MRRLRYLYNIKCEANCSMRVPSLFDFYRLRYRGDRDGEEDGDGKGDGEEIERGKDGDSRGKLEIEI